MKLYQSIASQLNIIERRPDTSFAVKAEQRLERLLKQLPSGSGFDAGCELLDNSTSNKLIFSADFHHMNEHGFYCGWSEHKVIIKPNLIFGFSMRITGRDERGIKDYIADTFHYILDSEV